MVIRSLNEHLLHIQVILSIETVKNVKRLSDRRRSVKGLCMYIQLGQAMTDRIRKSRSAGTETDDHAPAGPSRNSRSRENH